LEVPLGPRVVRDLEPTQQGGAVVGAVDRFKGPGARPEKVIEDGDRVRAVRVDAAVDRLATVSRTTTVIRL
jgi:hypothetical protein